MDRVAWQTTVHGVVKPLPPPGYHRVFKSSSTKHMRKINLSGKLSFKLNLNVLQRIHEDKNLWEAL